MEVWVCEEKEEIGRWEEGRGWGRGIKNCPQEQFCPFHVISKIRGVNRNIRMRMEIVRFIIKKFNSVDFVLVTGCLCELKYTGLPHYKRNSWAQFAKLKFIVTDKTLLHE